MATTSLRELLANPDVDVVYIATPNAAHAAEVKAAATAGKHILCEKPLATSVEDAAAAVEACRHAGVKLGINFQTRHYQPSVEIRQVVESGALGDILVAECVITPARGSFKGWRTDPALSGLGTLNNLGVHAFDLLRYLLGSEVVEATALLDVGRREELEILVLALLRFENGTLANVVVSQAIPHFRANVALYGTEGKVVGHSVTRPGVAGGELTIATGPEERVIVTNTVDGFERAIAAFQHAVVADLEPNASGIDGLRSVELTYALARSAREGRTVVLPR
jgi:1,5-anhydro-D-fructose reductase (1,5-anhydro-D-mannitol-forming)